MDINDFESIIDKFMTETKIRKFCRIMCGGYCCKEIECNKCNGSCNYPLTCKMFICKQLAYILNLKDYYHAVWELLDKIQSQLRWNENCTLIIKEYPELMKNIAKIVNRIDINSVVSKLRDIIILIERSKGIQGNDIVCTLCKIMK